eukprot:SAG31_NODE_4690_length_3030_cov_3.710338_3_plen_106_part_00
MCRNELSLLSAYNQLKTCIDWLAPTCVTDETVLAKFSDLTSKTAMSGGDTGSTISIISTIRSLITDAFDLIKNFVSQNISPTGVSGIKSVMSSYWFCIRFASSNV